MIPLSRVFAVAVSVAAVLTVLGQSVSQPQYTIQARVPITIVDVTVTDAKGKPVHGLKQTDFTILEDNKDMQPNSFGEHRTDQAAPNTPVLVKQDLPPNTFTNVTPAPPQATPIVILLIDNLNTPVAEQTRVKQRMLDFLDKMPAGMHMEVLGLDTHLRILQGFTDDRAMLSAAVNTLPPNEVIIGRANKVPMTAEMLNQRQALRHRSRDGKTSYGLPMASR